MKTVFYFVIVSFILGFMPSDWMVAWFRWCMHSYPAGWVARSDGLMTITQCAYLASYIFGGWLFLVLGVELFCSSFWDWFGPLLAPLPPVKALIFRYVAFRRWWKREARSYRAQRRAGKKWASIRVR